MFNPCGRVVQTLVANEHKQNVNLPLIHSRSPVYAHKKDHTENHFVSKVGAPETEKLVPTQTEATILHPW